MTIAVAKLNCTVSQLGTATIKTCFVNNAHDTTYLKRATDLGSP